MVDNGFRWATISTPNPIICIWLKPFFPFVYSIIRLNPLVWQKLHSNWTNLGSPRFLLTPTLIPPPLPVFFSEIPLFSFSFSSYYLFVRQIILIKLTNFFYKYCDLSYDKITCNLIILSIELEFWNKLLFILINSTLLTF